MGCSNATGDFLSTDDDSNQEGSSTKIPTNLKPLFASLRDYTQCPKSSAFPKWAEPPNTIACTNLSVINKVFSRKRFICEESLILDHCPDIIYGLKKGNSALQQHLVFLVLRIVSKGYNDCRDCLLSLGIFDAITPLIIHKNGLYSVCLLYTSDAADE